MRGAPRGARRSVDRGTHRPAIEPRKSASGCRRRRDSGRQHGGGAIASRPPTPRGLRPWHVRTLLAREPGELVAGPRRIPSGPHREGMEPSPMMHGHEKSGLAIVAENRANVDGRPSAEGGERRAGAKGNTSQTDTRRTPSRASVLPGLERVRTAARLNKEERFTALLHHVDTALLRQAYLWLKREAAPGVDGVRWAEYGQG